MAEPDSNPGQNPVDETDPFSATGMFLRSFEAAPTQAPDRVEESLAKPVAEAKPSSSQLAEAPPAPEGSPGPGEFTRVFQAIESERAAARMQSMVQEPAAVRGSVESTDAPSAFAASTSAGSTSTAGSVPGDFTRLFVKPGSVPEQPVRLTPPATPTPPAASGAPRMKGFSTPGISDSASVEGSFTQIFGGISSGGVKTSAPSATQASVPVAPPRVQTFAPPAPVQEAPAKEISWEREPGFATDLKPIDRASSSSSSAESIDTGSSATGLLSRLSDTSSQRQGARAEWGEPASSFPSFSSSSSTPYAPTPYAPTPYAPTPYAPPPISPPSSQPSADDSNSVTRLIRRLSEDVRVHPPAPVEVQTNSASVEVFPPARPPVAEPAPMSSGPMSSAPMSSGPGEFTRMISGDAIRAALSGQAPATPAPVAQPAPVAGGFAAPAITAPAVAIPPVAVPAPHFAAPAARAPAAAPTMPVPKVEPPKVAAPNLTAPAVAAPKSKLQEMLPLLLVVNTFLLIVLIVVVIFALRSK